jgi:hypothetical protein
MRFEIARRLAGTLAAGLVLGAVLLAAPAGADEWDESSKSDGNGFTDNALYHGSQQVHDLGVQAGIPDEDFYVVTVHPFSSYEFAVDSFTGDLDLAAEGLQRLSGETVLESAAVLSAGGALALRWSSGPGTADELNLVRVRGAGCGTSCSTSDTYRARFYETTYSVPRFNNSGSQVTVLLLQNATDRACVVTPFFMSATGAMIASAPASVAPHALLVVPTASVAAGQSGSVRIPHTCGHGGLSGKAVAVEPSTGFAFDTPLQSRPH